MMNLENRCKHGLYCECFICNFENEIEGLKNENAELKKRIAFLQRFINAHKSKRTYRDRMVDL